MSSSNQEEKEREAISFIFGEIASVLSQDSKIKENGCAACHVLFGLMNKMQLTETDAADLLTEVLLQERDLNEQFIEMVETVHMKQRMMDVTFAMKNREAKDRFIDAHFKNALDELGDIAKFGVDIALRKLIVSYVALEIAQTIGVDYHAATEELYYFMRKRDEETHESIIGIVESIKERASSDRTGQIQR